jgi:tetratricopeptide (TPR) repeat protein
MSRTARLWKGVGPLTLGGVLFSGALALADTPSVAEQLVGLARQAEAQGRPEIARSFYQNALKHDPDNADAAAALARRVGLDRVAMQNPEAAPAQTPPAPAPGAELSPLERRAQEADVARQQTVTDVRERLQAARELSSRGNPDAALASLRDTLTVVQSATNLQEDTRRRLENEVRNQIGYTEKEEERTNLERAEQYRIFAAQSARAGALDRLARDQDITNTLMAEFDSLVAEGTRRVLASGGLGDINTTIEPYIDARYRAQAARAISPGNLAPYAGMFTSTTMGFLAQARAYDELSEFRAMFTWADVNRASVPFPDTRAIEYPDRKAWQELSERRIKRYNDADYLFDRDEKTKAILSKLNERISMPFQADTPLEDVKRYIEQSTQDEAAGLPTGIPIYVDPQGLQDADKTMASTVTINLEGIPLKTTLRLILKQLGMTYTVKDGLLTITSSSSEDQPTEIRVYQVADLALIPISLFGGGGGGGMGGGMGGMGGGMGGMGGGMGGGGMGGGGMGGMGGMMSVPPQDPGQLPGGGSAFEEKKSN